MPKPVSADELRQLVVEYHKKQEDEKERFLTNMRRDMDKLIESQIAQDPYIRNHASLGITNQTLFRREDVHDRLKYSAYKPEVHREVCATMKKYVDRVQEYNGIKLEFLTHTDSYNNCEIKGRWD